MGHDRLQMQRLEYKYLINEDTALKVRDFVRYLLELDEYGLDKPDYSYPIHSIYLDSDSLATYRYTINGNKNRYKLRLRYYDDNPTSPVFFEVKRRVNNAILKQRGGVRREAVDRILVGQLPGREYLLSDSPKHLLALENFSRHLLELKATPKVHVAYLREAWVSTVDNSIRVTMDREVRVRPHFTSDLPIEMPDYAMPFGKTVILELKFTGRFPNWFAELVRSLGLWRECAAKYADGIVCIGEQRLTANAARHSAHQTLELGIAEAPNTPLITHPALVEASQPFQQKARNGSRDRRSLRRALATGASTT